MRRNKIIAAALLAGAALAGGASGDEAPWHPMALEAARAMHQATLPAGCSAENAAREAQAYPLWFGEEGAARDALLVEFTCRIGAYNVSSVYVLADQHGVASPVWFPSPQARVTRAGGAEDGAVEAVAIEGSVESREVVNARYDPASRTMEEIDKWRGLGDAYTLTRWGFRNGRFQLMHFAVDASYDGADNAVILFDEDIW